MDKKKIKIQCLLLICMFSNVQIFSQELFTKKLQWANQDSIEILTFQSMDNIIEWGKNFGAFAFVQSEKFYIKDSEIIILSVDVCSGISCLSLYVFKEKDDIWELLTTSQARLTDKLNIRVDNDQEKIIFEVKSRQIGELPFKDFL